MPVDDIVALRATGRSKRRPYDDGAASRKRERRPYRPHDGPNRRRHFSNPL